EINPKRPCRPVSSIIAALLAEAFELYWTKIAVGDPEHAVLIHQWLNLNSVKREIIQVRSPANKACQFLAQDGSEKVLRTIPQFGWIALRAPFFEMALSDERRGRNPDL